MSHIETMITRYFQQLGLTSEHASFYAALIEHGPQTLSQLSRSAVIERTKLYRLLPELEATHLIVVDSEYKHGVIEAAPLDNLELLLAERESKLQLLRQELPLLKDSLRPSVQQDPKTRVQFYRGASGIKQMLWNETAAKTEIIGLLHQGLQQHTGTAFFDRWVAKCNDQAIKSRSLVNEHFFDQQTQWHQTHSSTKLKHWQGRLITSDTFAITHSMVVYDNVLAYFNWQPGGEVFGVELHNQQLANTQRQFFELLWQQAK
jgi:sugar-specific transcriptional regulator TrmB